MQKGCVFCLLLFCFLPAQGQYLNFSKYAWQIFDTSNSEVPSNYITDLYVDEANTIWISTAAQPLVKIFNGGRWEDVPKDGLAATWWMNDWTQTSRSKYWIAGQRGYLLSFQPDYGVYDTLAIPDENPTVLASNDFDVILVGCVGGKSSTHNLYQVINGKTVESLSDRYGDVLCIYIEKNGDALVAFREGLYRYKQKSDGTYSNKPKQLSEQAYYEVATDNNGYIWGTCIDDGYLHRYDGKWRVYKGGPRELYCSYGGEERYVAHNLMVLNDGRVIISTQYNTGIGVLDGEVWRAYQPDLKDKSDGINRLALGPDGSIWCGTSRNGVAVFRPAVLVKHRKKRERHRDTLDKSRDSSHLVYKHPVEDGKTIPYIPDPTRKARTYDVFHTFVDSVVIRIWDSQKIDGDTISLYVNGVPVLHYDPLTAHQDTFVLRLKEGDNEILLYAHNLGSIPPNTATLIISMGAQVLSADLNSDLNTCERIIIRRKPVDGKGGQ